MSISTMSTTVKQVNGMWHWIRETSAGARYSKERFLTANDAIDAAISVAEANGVQCGVPRHLFDSYVMEQQMVGIDMYQNEIESGMCRNFWQAQGWQAAFENDAQPLPAYGWPLAELEATV